MGKYTKEQIEGIRTADVNEDPKTLAERLGVERDIIYYYRKKFSKQPVEKNRKKGSQKGVAKRGPREVVAVDRDDVDETDEAGEISVSLTLSVVHLDGWWNSLTTAHKASIFETNLGLNFWRD